MIYSGLYSLLRQFKKLTIIEIEEKLRRFKENEIEKFICDVFKLIKHDYFEEQSFFNFYAGASSSGDPFPCSSPQCRLQKVDSFARFSALYADKVLVPSPFDKLYESLSKNLQLDVQEISVNIKVLLILEPLVMAGIVSFSSTYMCLCQDCLKKVVKKENEALSKLAQMEEDLTSDFSHTIKCRLQRDDLNYAYFSIEGGEKYGLHDQTDLVMYEENTVISELLEKSNNNPIEISPEQVKMFGLANFVTESITSDLLNAQVLMNPVKSSYLTDRQYEIELLNMLDGVNCRNSQLFNDTFYHLIPIVMQSRISDIVKVRKDEGEAFSVYRDSVNQTLQNTRDLTEKMIRDIRRDVIEPEIHKMELTLTTNKKALMGKAMRDVLIIGAGLSIGYFTGLVNLDSMAVAGLLGGIPTICSLVDKFYEASTDSIIKDNRFYFLWKLTDLRKGI